MTELGDGKALGIGLTIPFNDHQMSYEAVVALAKQVEASGFDSLWMADHITGPTPMGATIWHETVTLLASLAPVVPRLVLGTDILVASYRHPVLAAKMLATLDIVTGGRLVIGTASGYIEREFGDLGVPFHQRGAYGEECIRVWKEMWSPGPANLSGQFFKLSDVTAEPKPVQQPRPPILLGGNAPSVLRRAVAVADGWHPIMPSMAGYKAGTEAIRGHVAESGRTEPFTLSISASFGLVTPDANDADDRTLLTGSPAQVLEDIAQLRDLGVSNIVFRPGLASVSNQEVLDQAAFIGEAVLPHVDRA